MTRGEKIMAIAENLKKYRKASNKSQMALSMDAKVSQAQISHIESGAKKNPGVKTVQKIAKALGITVEQLIK